MGRWDKEQTERNQAIVSRYASGERLKYIAESFNISRQRVWQIVQKNSTLRRRPRRYGRSTYER
jgi:hypothetical protein